ncbi:MAG: YihA family ribosome biogenesis GTP-binding protein [Gemmatimonadota bacterium]|nr:MAG: YihA family ribosome biogenesis GTP-binding protein [Gemmatimonadota bacterium]
MHHREEAPARRHRGGPGQERGLTPVTFVGSYPAADFRLRPPLPEVAFLGRSNVGKSSLINAVVGRRALAHTSKTPGKTKMVNVFDVDGRYYLVDLPGYGYARAAKPDRRRFRDLLREYLSTREPLAGVIWLLDVRREPSADDHEMAALLAERGLPILAAITKADKLGRGRRTERAQEILKAVGMTEEQCVVTSSRTREGIEQLQEAVAGLVDGWSGSAA